MLLDRFFMEYIEYIIIAILFLLLVFIMLKANFYKNFYENYNDGVSIIDNGEVVDCNTKLLELFKYENKKQFLSLHPFELSPPLQPDGSFSVDIAGEMMQKAKKDGTSSFDWVFLTSDKKEQWVEISIIKPNSLLYKDRYFMIWKDISKRLEAENKLKEFNQNLETMISKEIEKNKEQERMLFVQSKQAKVGEMISMIAHQWRQPLAAISSTVINLKMKILLSGDDKTKLIEYIDTELDDIESYTQTLTQTIDDFRDFYKIDKIAHVNSINVPIEKTFSIVKNSLESHDIQVSFELNSKEKIAMYENELIQVFLDIFQNAQDNFDINDIENKQIKISTKDFDDFIQISFSDNGGGIKDDIIEKIFEPYFSTKQEKNGTGLGLYMCSKIIKEHHKGNIKAINEDLGVCFQIELKKVVKDGNSSRA